MSILELYSRGVKRRLDLLQDEANDEAWKAAYREAKGCHYFEFTLNSIIEATRLLPEMEREWRSEVYRGLAPLKEPEEKFVKGLFQLGLKLAEATLKTLADFEGRGFRIGRAEEFRDLAKSLERSISNWASPRLSKSPAMRCEDVSEEEADELRAILDAPPGSPGKLKVAPLSIPEGDPSLLR